MATKRISSMRVQRGFKAGLSSAILEWFLIFLLFLDALFSYLVTKFARFCELETPCLFCSRLDHVFGDEKAGFYWDLVCSAHKLEISSLVFCQVHDKLAGVHGMCEGCLSSFVKEKKPNSEAHRLLVAKLGKNHECCVHKNSLKHLMRGSKSEKHCSCCSEPWKLKSYYTHRFLPTKAIPPEVAELNVPLPSPVKRSLPNIFDGLNKRREKVSGLKPSSFLGGFDPLSHIGYTELKITSDSESEVPFSDDDDASAPVREADYLKEQFVPPPAQPELHTSASDILLKVPSDVLSPDKLNNQAVVCAPSSGPQVLFDSGEATSSSSAIAGGHGLEEFNWQKVEQKSDPPALPELISLHDIPSSSNTPETLVKISGDTLNTIGIGDLVQASRSESDGVCKLESDLATRKRLRLKPDEVVELPGETLDVEGSGDLEKISTCESGEVCKSESGLVTISASSCLKKEQVLNSPRRLLLGLKDLTDASRPAVDIKGGQASGMLTELFTVKDSVKVNEDLKLLLSQISTGRGLELSVNDASPRVRGLSEELKLSDVSSSNGSLTNLIRPPIERNESGFESLDGSIVCEIEGESVVDRLKRQVDYDRKSMSALYKELEEERNASAIAANQAMAMITWLQEEKASLHMEALQYLRMMEEQAEYDVEALQKANDLLADKEKEIQDLEAELDIYRNKFQDETVLETIQESYGLDGAEMRTNTNGPCTPHSMEKFEDINKLKNNNVLHGDNKGSIINGSLLGFEDERLYISECLKKLENKLNPCSDNGVLLENANGGDPGKEAQRLNDLGHRPGEVVIQDNIHMEQDSPLVRKGEERSTPLVGDPQNICKESNHLDGPNSSLASTTNDSFSLQNEVLDLNERLEELESDRNFLKHTVNSLRNGDEGLKYIQEIALHLRELRSIGTRRGKKDVA